MLDSCPPATPSMMQGRDIDRILSFDVGFDGIPGIARVS